MNKRPKELIIIMLIALLTCTATSMLACLPLGLLQWSLSPLLAIILILTFCRHKFFLLFWGLATGWLLIYLALPLLFIFGINLILPESLNQYPGFLFSFGYLSLLSFIIGSINYVILPALISRSSGLQEGQSCTSIQPTDGLTLKQISALNEKPRYHFLFGSADEEAIASWGILARTLALASRSRTRAISLCGVILLCWPAILWFGSGGTEGRIQRDIAHLWETENQTSSPYQGKISSISAMNAAKRLFSDDSYFIGKNIHEIQTWLHFNRMDPQYKLNQDTGDIDEPARFILRIDDGKQAWILALFFNDKNLCTGGYLVRAGTLATTLQSSNRPKP